MHKSVLRNGWAKPSAVMPGLTRQSILFRKKMDARVASAFTRVFDALLPAHDGGSCDRMADGGRSDELCRRSLNCIEPFEHVAPRMDPIGPLRGKAKGDVTLYGKLARSLDLSIDDLAPQTE